MERNLCYYHDTDRAIPVRHGVFVDRKWIGSSFDRKWTDCGFCGRWIDRCFYSRWVTGGFDGRRTSSSLKWTRVLGGLLC